MKSRNASLSLLLLGWLVLATPLWGGTVYVPLVTNQDLGGSSLATEIRLTNDSARTREVTYLFLPELTDGTVPDRELESVTVTLAPHQSLVLADLLGSGERGVLEVTGDKQISVTSRLVGVGEDGKARAGTELPVVTSENRVAAGRSVLLQGWRRDAPLTTDLYLFNLGLDESTCEYTVYRRRGSVAGSGTATLPPLSLLPVDDVLAQLGETRRNEARAVVSCSRRFHTFALTVDTETAEIVYVSPSGSGSSAFSPPGGPAPPPPPPAPVFDCPDGALFEKAGAFHRPKPGKETRRFEIPTAGGQVFTRLVIDVDFTPDDWSDPPDGNHAVVWLNRTEKWAGNVLAYVNLFGPDKNFAKISTNAGLPSGSPLRAFKEGGNFEKGVRYHLSYIYDTSIGLMEAVFTENSFTADEREVTRVRGTTTTNVIRTKDPGLFVYFGHPLGAAGPETPTYEWVYLNLCVQLE